MADFAGVSFVCRLTREPERKEFANGGSMLTFGVAWGTRVKNRQTGTWDKKPNYIDAKRFSRGEKDTQIDVLANALHKGSLVFINGKLEMDEWDDKTTGQKRTKHVIMVDDVIFLDKKDDGQQRQDKGGYGDMSGVGDDSGDMGSGGGGTGIPF